MISYTQVKPWLSGNWLKSLMIPSVLYARKLCRRGEAHYLPIRTKLKWLQVKLVSTRVKLCTKLSKLIITRFKYTG